MLTSRSCSDHEVGNCLETLYDLPKVSSVRGYSHNRTVVVCVFFDTDSHDLVEVVSVGGNECKVIH